MDLGILNDWLITIIDVVLQLWPSTPEAFKLSTMLGGLQSDFPAAPWYLVGQMLPFVLFILGGVAVAKAWKLVWP